LLSDSTPAELRARTGTDDLEEAFLRVVREQQAEVAA
jgi:ABC-2 type transport system ATP-binding protein